ncbi:MAG: BMP family ABC transporter substrate-binding protein [Firmicutes bacterium]|nr:BMP family ABC transporter substrate-binding protein [Bacillota bacterium]
MKKVLAILLVLAMIFCLAACGDKKEEAPANNDSQSEQKNEEPEKAPEEEEKTPEATVYKVGMVCIGDEKAAYDRNFYMAADAAQKILHDKGIEIEWVKTYNHPEGDPVAEDNRSLAEDGCIAIFNNSYGQEPAMLQVAPEFPETYFVALTNEGSQRDDLDNTLNAFPSIFEARYIAGVAAGCKLQEMIDNGDITADKALIGYVGAYPFAEVKSGYTAFYLGARSVCPSATMIVEFINSWGDPDMEAGAAQDLCDRGAVLISQHSDSTTPATTAEKNGVFHVGYNISMSDVAPNASIISSRIDWTNYFVYVIETIVNGGKPSQDYKGYGLANGDVCLTELNTKVAAAGTQEAMDKAIAAIKSGSLSVFDTSAFTVGGQTVTSWHIDITGDYVPDDDAEAIFNGQFNESYFKSAPAFDLDIDGITLLN